MMEMNRAFVLLGSNIEREKNLPAAVRLLRQQCRVRMVSSVYETVPVGLEEQPCFWNAAVLLETKLTAAQLKSKVLAEIERELCRVRTEDPNAPRTIDVDITLFNHDSFNLDETHHIPDPDLLKFPHVAVPIAELAPRLKHPETDEQMQEIASRLMHVAQEKGEPPLIKHAEVTLA
jgi:2-amino-4-hydroxy-6-hydroxymethyldihydropteridine diphosphokinase